MFHALLEAVRREASGERALESVRDLTRFHRVQASPGYDEAARWIVAKLESIERSVVNGWSSTTAIELLRWVAEPGENYRLGACPSRLARIASARTTAPWR